MGGNHVHVGWAYDQLLHRHSKLHPPLLRTYLGDVRVTEYLFGDNTATGEEAHGPGGGVNNLVRDGANQLALFIQFVSAEH